jgi:hypothetical protein
MTKVKLGPDGYERILKKIQDIEDTLSRSFFEPDTAPRQLLTANGELYELRHILNEVCLLAPDTAGPSGPNAA